MPAPTPAADAARPIALRCRCGNAMDYDRSIDPGIPAEVVRIESSCCDRCDVGDFGTEVWFNAAGEEVLL